MTPPDAMALAAVRLVVETLERLSVPYHVGGSFAISAYGIPRASADVDIVADLETEHIAPFVERLQAHYYVNRDSVLEAVRQRSSFNLIHSETAMKVDVFVAEPAPFARQEQERSRRATFGDAEGAPSMLVKSPEDLILRKLLWYRAGHEVSERQWSDVIGLLKALDDELDLEYVRRWAVELHVADLLDRALSAARD
jgi:hypothetical protein